MPAQTYATEIKLRFQPTHPRVVQAKLEELLANPVVTTMARTQLSNPRFNLMPPTATEATLWVYFDAATPQEAVAGKRKVQELMENPLVDMAIKQKVPGSRLIFSPHPPQAA